MRSCFLLVFLLVLGACTFNSPLPTPIPSPGVEVEQTSEGGAAVRLDQITPTSTTGVAAAPPTEEPTVGNRAFEDGVPLAARVNDQPIFLDDYEKQLARFEQALSLQGIDITTAEGQAAFSDVQRQLLESLLDQVIIEQQATKLGLTLAENEAEDRAKEAIEQLEDQQQFETWLANNDLIYKDFISGLRSQLIVDLVFNHVTQDAPISAEQIRLRYIRVAEENRAAALIEQLKSGESFVSLAQKHSLDEISQSEGSDLSWLPRATGLIPAAVEDVAFSLIPGEVSGPIKTSIGFYIIKLEDRDTEQLLTEEMLYLLKKQIFDSWLREQRAATEIERYIVL